MFPAFVPIAASWQNIRLTLTRSQRADTRALPEKDPPVYLDYDQTALDAAYDQTAYAPNREQLIMRRIRESELARLRIGEPERVAYGPAEIERLKIYRTGRAIAPVLGVWRSGRSKDFGPPAEMFLTAGAHYVVPDEDLTTIAPR